MDDDSFIELSKYIKTAGFTGYDLLVCAFLLVLFYAYSISVKNKHNKDPRYSKYYMLGLTAKLVGGFAFAIIYTYYYSYGGDTKTYWSDALLINNVLFNEPEAFWDVFTRNWKTSSSLALDTLYRMVFSESVTEYRVIQISYLISWVSGGSYFGGTLWFAFLSFQGIWRMFLLFSKKYPEATKWLAISILFFPSVCLWGSGVMKDTIVLGAVGGIMYSLDKVFTKGASKVKYISILVVLSYLAFTIKAYVIISLVPGVLLWRGLHLRKYIRNKFIRAFTVPIFLTLSLVGSLNAVEVLAQYRPKYSLENFILSAQAMQNWHYKEGHNTSAEFGRGSSYSLGEYEATPTGLIKIFPAAVNVTLFRPYPWETNSIMQLISAIESSLLFLFTIWVFFKVGFLKFLKYVNNDSFLLMAISFSIFFSFAVGFSAYNFGALARYKIPAIPFYISTLAIVYVRVRAMKRLKRAEREKKRMDNRGTMKYRQFA